MSEFCELSWRNEAAKIAVCRYCDRELRTPRLTFRRRCRGYHKALEQHAQGDTPKAKPCGGCGEAKRLRAEFAAWRPASDWVADLPDGISLAESGSYILEDLTDDGSDDTTKRFAVVFDAGDGPRLELDLERRKDGKEKAVLYVCRPCENAGTLRWSTRGWLPAGSLKGRLELQPDEAGMPAIDVEPMA